MQNMATSWTVMNDSGLASEPDSLLWIIDQVDGFTESVFINFDDSVETIELSAGLKGSIKIGCSNLTINGLHSDGMTRVRIINSNTQPNALALFSVEGSPIAVKPVLNLLNLEMVGNPTITDPALRCRFFHISYVENISIISCLISDNWANNSVGKNQGGGLYIQAPTASLFIGDCTFQNNTATAGGGLYIGSVSTSTVQIMSCDFIGNTSTSNGGGGLMIRGNSLATMVFDTVFQNNGADGLNGDGAGLYVAGSDKAIRRCTFNNNTASRTGGGLYTEADLLVLRCRFNGNTASGGGGLGCQASTINMELCSFNNNTSTGVNTSTILASSGGGVACQDTNISACNILLAGNSAVNGGAIAYEGGVSPASFSICNSTLCSNTASQAGGGFYCPNTLIPLEFVSCTIVNNDSNNGGGIEIAAGVDLQIGNTILALNTALTNPDISGTVTSQGNNLIGVADISNSFESSDLTGTLASPLDPGIASLADNGGFTQTIALLPSSPAIDAGNSTLLPQNNPLLAYDQRGSPYSRINNNRTDIGAYVHQPSVICFRAGSQVLVKDVATDLIQTVDIAQVFSSTYAVYDTLTNDYVPIIYNAVYRARKFYRITPGLLDTNVPDANLDMAGPHLIVHNGLRVQASDIDGAELIETDSELVYSICTATESNILINNTQVIGWDSSQWDTYTQLNHISWINNS